MTVISALPDAEAACRRVANLLASYIADARHFGDQVNVALAGGSTPRRAYQLLADMEGSWDHVHLWLGDERCVPDDDPESNALMVEEEICKRARATPPVLHRISHFDRPEDAAWAYGMEIIQAMGPKPVFDFVLLGLGEDGHTASLFPGHPAAAAEVAPVVAVRGAPKPPPDRISLTLPVLRRAKKTILLAAGEEKREPLDRVLAGDEGVPPGRLGAGLDEVVCDVAAHPG
ncbi:MAG: 6-phosphogluconolactonase [Solirubrobacteraceae bacterium]|nr:6-phosphogluconolactonase [Solirubrobacteraceae bacterium]